MFRIACLVLLITGFVTSEVSAQKRSDVSKSAEINTEKTDKRSKAKPNKNKVICRYERVTGSHFRTRICRTVAQMEAERSEAQRIHGGALSGAMSSTSE